MIEKLTVAIEYLLIAGKAIANLANRVAVRG